MDGYNLYKTYVSLKNHFTYEHYDFLKYGTKINISEETFRKRKDSNLFYKLGKVLEGWKVVPFLVSQFIELSSFTINYVFENPIKSQRIFDRWKDRTKDILGLYKKDLKTLAKESSQSWKNCLIQEDGDYPLIFKLVVSNRISPETYSMLDDLFHYTSKSYKGLDMDVMFSSMNLKYRKYRIFITPTLQDVLNVTPRDLTSL